MEETTQRIESAIQQVAESSGFTVSDIYGSKRNTELVFLRLAIVDVLRSSGYTFREIGRMINRDRTVAIRSKRRADDLASTGDNMYLKIRRMVAQVMSFLTE